MFLRRAMSGLLIGFVATMLVLAGASAWAQTTFTIDPSTGLSFTPSSDVTAPNFNMFAGGTVGDFDNDGWPDLFLLGCGNTDDALYMNNHDGTFTDEAAAWGVDLGHRGAGATAGDFNNDGWLDIYVTSRGDMTNIARAGRHILYRNNGDSTFTNIAVAAGVNSTSTTSIIATSPAWGDYDLDGDLDLFVATWAPKTGTSDGNRLFRNNGNETFTDVTVAAGVFDTGIHGFSPRFVDMNGDRYPELLIAADYSSSRYFVNNGDGTFTDGTVSSGTGLDANGMGQTVGDMNNDGLLDWYVTSIYRDVPQGNNGNYLYVNQGNDVFSAIPEAAGATNGGWGWGVAAHDYDHDGLVDIAETNGWGSPEWFGEFSYLFMNNGNLTFTESHVAAGFVNGLEGRSLLTLDYDLDGDMDIVISAYDMLVHFYRNDISGANTNWLTVKLDTGGDPYLAPNGFGARVIATAGGVSRVSAIAGGANYLGQSELLAHFGLGSATLVDTLVVEWPDGRVTTLNNLAANQSITVAPSISGAPGEASRQSVAAEHMLAVYNKVSGQVEVTYTPACNASDHTLYYGDLADVAMHTYAGSQCWVGTSGSAAFDPGGLVDAFFLVVGNTGAKEGSYGTYGAGAVERPEDLGTPGCNLPQDLVPTCP